MREVRRDGYPVQAVAFWAIEMVYNQAWQIPGQMVQPYGEYADRWGNAEFTEYVKQLERQADEALTDADRDIEDRAAEVFLRITDLEKDFWQMAYAVDDENRLLPLNT